MTDPRGYTYKNFFSRDGEYHPLPESPGDGWRFLLELETIAKGDEFWATARGCWVQILEPTTLGRAAIYLIDGMQTKIRRLVDPGSIKEGREKKETAA